MPAAEKPRLGQQSKGLGIQFFLNSSSDSNVHKPIAIKPVGPIVCTNFSNVELFTREHIIVLVRARERFLVGNAQAKKGSENLELIITQSSSVKLMSTPTPLFFWLFLRANRDMNS
mmetsp:Transcript_11851/g.19306  ORF Transcript_11851/g.19306 Transcript_11851/m.19306 type:complete len:116 (+) Transcript_11851:1220-1567(+)